MRIDQFTRGGLRRIALVALLAFAPLRGAASPSDDIEKEARAIENLLIAPCCWRQPVAVHQSPASTEVRGQIREMLAKGMSREEILDAYVDAYGEKILSAPRAQGFNLLSYVLPAVALVAGGLLVTAFFRRHRAATAPQPAVPGKIPGKYADLLKREVGE